MFDQQHEMILEETYPSGAQEWYCLQCDRRLLVMNWHPDGKQIIISPGDGQFHSTVEQQSLAEAGYPSQYMLRADDGSRLDIWNAWLDKVDFESWWNDPLN